MVFGFISNLIFGDQGNKNDQELILISCYFGHKLQCSFVMRANPNRFKNR